MNNSNILSLCDSPMVDVSRVSQSGAQKGKFLPAVIGLGLGGWGQGFGWGRNVFEHTRAQNATYTQYDMLLNGGGFCSFCAIVI